jgi:hypothetical protein
VAPTETEAWPETWAAARVLSAMSGQWVMGPMGGVLGLRYEALPVVMRYLEVQKKDRRDVFADLRIMEMEAVGLLNRP